MHRIAGALIAATFLLGCDDDDDEETRPQQHQLAAAIEGNPGWEQLSGEAEVNWTEGEGRFTAGATLDGDEPGEIRPWHVHFGTCATGGAIVSGDEEYPRLTIGDDGSASASATIAFELDPSAPYHVNVHISDDDLGTLIACGDLQAADGAAGTGGTAGSGGAGTGGTAGTGGDGGIAGGGSGGGGGTTTGSGGTTTGSGGTLNY